MISLKWRLWSLGWRGFGLVLIRIWHERELQERDGGQGDWWTLLDLFAEFTYLNVWQILLNETPLHDIFIMAPIIYNNSNNDKWMEWITFMLLLSYIYTETRNNEPHYLFK